MIDALGHPITAGCTVITAPHWSPKMSEIVTVERVTKTRVMVKMPCTRSYMDPISKTWSRKTEVRELSRFSHQVLVIDKQLNYNRKVYPEHML